MVSEALQQSFMATKHSSTSSLPWIWVIEALASSSEIDTSLLINLVKKIPEISDDLGRNAREMVSLRVLESLFVPKNSDANSVASVPGDKIELDPSRGCEDVLRCILLEVPESNLKTATPDMLKWDVRSFVMKKRSLLPKCLLQQLKDAIVKSVNPFSTSLKERSGLESGNHSRDGVTADAVDSDGFKKGHEIGNINTRCAAPTENLDTLTQGNKNDLQEDQPGSTLLPAKRSFNAATTYETEVNKTKAIPENSSDPCAKAAKKFNQDVVGHRQNTAPNLVLRQRDGVLAESCGGSQSVVQKGNSEDESRGTDLASQKNDFLNLQYAQGDDSLATGDCTELNLCVKCNEGGDLFVCSSDTCSVVIHENCLVSAPNFDYKGNFYCPFCAYSRAISEYLEGKKKVSLTRRDLAAFIGLGAGQQSKKSLPRSQGMKKHQSREYTNELCRNETGKNLLNEVTEARSAPVNRSSVGAQAMQTGAPQPEASLPRNEKGKNVLNEVTEAGSAPDNRSSIGAQVMRTSAPQPEASLTRNESERNSLNEVTETGSAPANKSSVRAQVMQTGTAQPETSLPRNEIGRNSLNEATEVGNTPAKRISVGAQVMQNGSPQLESTLPKQCLVAGQQPDKSPLRCHRSRQNQSREEELRHDENRNENSLEKAEEAGNCPVNRNSTFADVTPIHPPQPLVPQEHVGQGSSDIEESSEEEEEDEIGSNYRVQFRNREKKSCPWIPQRRRKMLPWTKIEEETLKEGLVRFSHFRDRWKRILEFGGDVFLKGRTSGDLKDKWRNISKASEKAT